MVAVQAQICAARPYVERKSRPLTAPCCSNAASPISDEVTRSLGSGEMWLRTRMTSNQSNENVPTARTFAVRSVKGIRASNARTLRWTFLMPEELGPFISSGGASVGVSISVCKIMPPSQSAGLLRGQAPVFARAIPNAGENGTAPGYAETTATVWFSKRPHRAKLPTLPNPSPLAEEFVQKRIYLLSGLPSGVLPVMTVSLPPRRF